MKKRPGSPFKIESLIPRFIVEDWLNIGVCKLSIK